MSKVKSWFRAAWIVLAVAAVIVVLDQWTKQLVRDSIPEYTAIIPIQALGEYFQFEHVRNYGAAFGILQNQQMLFAVIGVVVAIAILVYVRYLPLDKKFVRVLLGLQLGGAIGNLIDRLTQLDEAGRGYVTDFVKMGIPGVYFWPNYNIADMAIVCGVIGLGIYIIVDDIRQQRAAKSAQAEGPTTADPTSAEL
jgi:signal peptidase II